MEQKPYDSPVGGDEEEYLFQKDEEGHNSELPDSLKIYQRADTGELDILQMLHKKKLKIIEEDFNKEEKGLSKEQFVKIMLNHLQYKKSPAENLAVTLNLIELFNEIDVNGDETMEWEEFSNHIIELGLLRKDRNTKTTIKTYNLSDHIKDTYKHESEIERIFFFEKLKQLVVLERDSPKIKVYDPWTSEILYEVNAHKGAVLCVDFIPESNLIVTSSDDLTINFWDANNYNLKQIISTPEIQLTVKYVRWSQNLAFLYTAGTDAIIHIYDVETFKEKGNMSGWNPFFKNDKDQYGHAGPIMDILPIYSQNNLATASMDGHIGLWDVPSHTFKKELRGHQKGVHSLAWSNEAKVLLSAGFDHEAYVWNAYVTDRIFLLRGHNHPLIGVRCLEGTPQAVTADISGMIKVWDMRNFMCMQTFNVPVEELNCFTLTYPKKRIVTGTKHLLYYDYDEPKDQYLTDEKMCLKVLYNEILFAFITLHPDCVKVWDARNGKLTSVYRQLSGDTELTTCVLDHRQRKLFVGDADGGIFTVNVKNGAKMRTFDKHDDIVTDLGYWSKEARLISCSRDNSVKIHDDTSSDRAGVRHPIETHRNPCNGLSIQQDYDMAASSSDDHTVVITNLITYRQEGQLKHDYEVKKVLFLSPHDVILSTDNIGTLYFWCVYPSVLKNKLQHKADYKTRSVTNFYEKFPVTAFAFYRKQNYLLIGDDFGNVAIWNLTKLLEKLDVASRPTKNFRKEKPADTSDYDLTLNFDGQKKNPNKTYITEMDSYDTELITEVSVFERVHQDGITSIEVIEHRETFATSSFDCCVYIWTFQGKKIGKLILGEDKDWGFFIDETILKEQRKREAEELLSEVQKIDYKDIFKQQNRLVKSDSKQKLTTQKLSEEIDKKQFGRTKSSEQDRFDPSLPKRDKIINAAKNALAKHWSSMHAGILGEEDLEDYNISLAKNTALLEEDEDDDQQILYDLEFSKSNPTYVNKGAFKTKTKRVKAKLR